MYAKILTSSLFGLSGEKTWVEVTCDRGLPAFSVVGLANQSVRESRDRIHSAIINCGYEFPVHKITVNLTPANRKKEGTHFDLPMALALVISADVAKAKEYDESYINGNVACFGELTLDGRVRPVDGALSMLIGLKNEGVDRVMLPKENLPEAMLVKGMLFYPVETLSQAIDCISGYDIPAPVEASGYYEDNEKYYIPDFADIRGQETAKRAAQVAAAGMHGMLMIGPPGVGKSMIGKRIPGILPPLTYEEQLAVTQIYSVAGKLSKEKSMICQRPFRAPHHSITPVSLVGGGNIPKPGEISLAHMGVLFLDELPEFNAKTLDLLRQPMEDKEITITRINGNVVFPASFMLVAAMNPCRCGYYGDPVKVCTCTETERQKYIGRVSGPLLDRIDLHVSLERILYSEISERKHIEKTDSSFLRDGVLRAVEAQNRRYKDIKEVSYNSQLTPKMMDEICHLNESCRSLTEAAFSKWNLSPRSYHRILKVARTIADIEGADEIAEDHILEALSYRMPDKYFK